MDGALSCPHEEWTSNDIVRVIAGSSDGQYDLYGHLPMVSHIWPDKNYKKSLFNVFKNDSNVSSE